MPDQNFRSRLRDFIRELRRRKVIRATIAYAIAGVGIAEGAAIFLPPLGAPAWVPNMIAVIVVLGFPVALALAWAFDIVPDTDDEANADSEDEAGSAVSAARESRSATRMEGERLGHYDVLERLGAGGMGVVYKALDTRLDRVVAFKVLSDHLLADDDARERFLVEAKAAAALDHPNICAIHEVGETEDDRFYIAMQYYEGETLRQRIDKGPVPLGEALDIAAQICRGLVRAADQGIIHRDIKPANMILAADGTVKIVDFGLAKYAGSGITSTGSHVGTIAYMSPEQTRGDEVDQRTDIWSLGVVLYEMLSGIRPFRGGSDQAIINTILNSKPESLAGLVPSLPPNVIAVVDRATQRDPDRRYPDAGAVLKDLELLADDSSCQISIESTPSLPAEGERRRVTVIACSIDGFETLLESLDPDEAENNLQALRARVQAVVEDYGGRLNEFSEEKFVALFGVPNTHEDDRLRAVRAALEIMADDAVQEALADAIRLRIAVASEQVAIRATETGERRYRVGGNVVRDSTRLAMMAGAGEILMHPDFARIVAPFVLTEERDSVRLLPDQAAITPIAVLGESGHASRLDASQPGSLTEFVGRQNELAALSQALEDIRSGTGRFVTVFSDVGVGKSRLLFEFGESLENKNIRSTMGRCRERGSLTPWLPFIASMKEMLGLPQVLGDDSHDEVVEKTRDLAVQLEDYLPVILHILSINSDQYPLPSYLEGEDLHAALGEALISVFTLGSAGKPLVMLLEDWHWADEGSREVLFQLREMIETYPLMVVVTSRPVPAGSGSVPTGDVHLELSPLRGDPAVAMLSAALAGARIPEELSARISEKTGGNPFFIEELCRTLVESGALVIENGEAHLTGGIDKLLIPDTVQAVLKSRLDRLDPEAREVLRCAAVIGRQFGLELLSQVVPSRQRINAAMETLRSAGLVHRSGLVPEPIYRFKHALTLDVTYESLLERQKKERHAAVGEAIENLYPDQIEEYSTQLAAHFAAAEDWDRAIRYGLMAAKRATALWRLPETAEMLLRVRQWIQSSDKNVGERAKLLVPLLLELERHLEKLGRRDEQQSVIDELGDLLSTDVPTRNRGEVLVRQGDLYTLSARHNRALSAFKQALEIAEQLDDAELRCKALRSLGHVLWSQGRYSEAVPWLEQVIDFAREHGDARPLVTDLCNLGRAVRKQEQWDRAMAIGEEALELANESGNPIDQLYAYNYKGHLFRAMKQTDTAIQAFEEGARRAHEARIPAREAFCILGAAALYLETGRHDDALTAYRRSVKLARRANRADQLAQSLLLLADALVTCGKLDEAIAHFEEAVTVLRRIGTEEPLASALSQLAAAQQSEDSTRAETTWREALEMHERLGDRQSTMAALERVAILRRSADRHEAHQLFSRALSLAAELEDRETEARIRNSLAVIAWQGGEIEETEKQYRMAAALLRQGDNRESLGVVLNGLGAVVTRQNRAGDALVILEEALASNREYGDVRAEADSLAALGAASRAAGNLKDASTWYQQCVECRRTHGDRTGEGWALQRLGEVSRDAGEWEKAQAFSAAALAIGREIGDTDLESLAGKLQSLDKTQKPD
jgi:serine/threonine protein kinase/tetratricopeptide (TPR) repeat protein